MRTGFRTPTVIVGGFLALVASHSPLLRLPYFWDEAGYYIPAAWDIYRTWELVPTSTLPTGHPPLVMVYLALAWHLFGFSPIVTRGAMLLIAAATVAATYALARRVAGREAAIWSASLLAISPMFFAQSTLVYLDLPTALFTTLAVLALLEERMLLFAVVASLAVVTKETAVVMLPVAWACTYFRARGQHAVPQQEAPGEARARHSPSWQKWTALLVPLLALFAWALYYHHRTGYWTGNAEYLQYNLYSTLSPGRVFWSLLRRMYEMFVGGFNWLLVTGAAAGYWWGLKKGHGGTEAQGVVRSLIWLAGGLIAAYLFLLSLVGGAVLPRYLLPVFPVFFVVTVTAIRELPRSLARGLSGVVATCFVVAWFINPPYPFAYENNLAYADFIHLHQEAARYLESRPAGERILTAWPATDELCRPFLGYVRKPLRTTPLEGFTARDFKKVAPESFDLLYIYSRKWEPLDNWLALSSTFRQAQERHFGYAPQVGEEELVFHYHLTLLRAFKRRGQWVRIYAKQESDAASLNRGMREANPNPFLGSSPRRRSFRG